MESKQVGVWGEKIARNYLKDRGYKILDKNYVFRIPGDKQRGEIDIVARRKRNVLDVVKNRKKSILFVEVKTLMSGEQFPAISPEQKVNYPKQRKLVKAAESWLMKNKVPLDSPWQIDIISVIINKNTGKPKIKYFKNAVGS